MEGEKGFPEQVSTKVFFRKGIYEAGKDLDEVRLNKIILNFYNVMKRFNYI
jgi:hypothetical protein